jgi:DNA-binding transcriptional LysR family regulator
LGDPLFVRSDSKMIPTTITNEIIAPVHSALSTIEGTLKNLHSFNPADASREFRIGLHYRCNPVSTPAVEKVGRMSALPR